MAVWGGYVCWMLPFLICIFHFFNNSSIFDLYIFSSVDGGYTEWSVWSTCTLTCVSGTQTRTRQCTNPEPLYGGALCSGDSSANQACNEVDCPSKLISPTIDFNLFLYKMSNIAIQFIHVRHNSIPNM